MKQKTERAWPLISLCIAGVAAVIMARWTPPMWLRLALWWLLLRRMLQQWILADTLYRKVRWVRAWRRAPLRFYREAGARADVFWQLRRAQEAAVFSCTGLLVGAVFLLYTGRAWDWLVFVTLSVYGSLAGMPANAVCKDLCKKESRA